MSWELPPVAVCRKCGGFLSTHNAHLISEPCHRHVGDERCHGRYSSRLENGSWRRCHHCQGTGFLEEEAACSPCHGSGWHFAIHA